MKAGTKPVIEDKKMPLLDHLVELRTRLLWSVLALVLVFFGAFFIAKDLYQFLARPLADILKQAGQGEEAKMIFTDLTEVFFTYVKVAFFFAVFVTCPVFLTQIWKFVAPGLYKNERRAFGPYLVASPLLFLLGASLVYYMIVPLAWEFFLSFQAPASENGVEIELLAKVNEYLSLVMTLVFAFGLCFQLPVVMTLLARAGIASADGMAKKRRYAIVIVFIVAAIFTPPDPLSQLSLAIPIIVLYEFSIVAARMIEKKRRKQRAEQGLDDDEAEEDDEDEEGKAAANTGKDLTKA